MRIRDWEDRTPVFDALVGQRVVEVDEPQGALILSDGTRIVFDQANDDCCSWIELKSLSTTDHIITRAEFQDNEDETGNEGPYKAWLHVVTEAGELNVADAEGDASNGYYLHGFALGVEIQKGTA